MFFTVRTKLAVDAATAAKSSGRRSFSGAKAKVATCKLPDKQVKNAETVLRLHLIHKVLHFPGHLLHKYYILKSGIAEQL